jgi:hypothetical protein
VDFHFHRPPPNSQPQQSTMMMNQGNTAPASPAPEFVSRVKLSNAASAAEPVHTIERHLNLPPNDKADRAPYKPEPATTQPPGQVMSKEGDEKSSRPSRQPYGPGRFSLCQAAPPPPIGSSAAQQMSGYLPPPHPPHPPAYLDAPGAGPQLSLFHGAYLFPDGPVYGFPGVLSPSHAGGAYGLQPGMATVLQPPGAGAP